MNTNCNSNELDLVKKKLLILVPADTTVALKFDEHTKIGMQV